MKRSKSLKFLPATFFTLFLAVTAFAQMPSGGKVVEVADGDTISVQTAGPKVSVRLEGIDAPEHGQSFGDASRQHLAQLTLGKPVNLDCNGVDRYSRYTCKVLLLSGDDAGLEQIQVGLAWHYKQYQRLQSATDRAAYGAAEDQARHAKRGLWSESNPVQPQDFRHGTRSQFCADNNDHRIACSDTYEGPVRGNRRSKIYHWPGCPNYDDIAEQNRVEFPNAVEAEKAGYRGAYNCP